jgi:hypothetical protein
MSSVIHGGWYIMSSSESPGPQFELVNFSSLCIHGRRRVGCASTVDSVSFMQACNLFQSFQGQKLWCVENMRKKCIEEKASEVDSLVTAPRTLIALNTWHLWGIHHRLSRIVMSGVRDTH